MKEWRTISTAGPAIITAKSAFKITILLVRESFRIQAIEPNINKYNELKDQLKCRKVEMLPPEILKNSVLYIP